MDTNTIPVVAPQSGVVILSIGPNAVKLDKPLNVDKDQVSKGVSITLVINGKQESRRVLTARDGIVSVGEGFSCAPHPGTAWSV